MWNFIGSWVSFQKRISGGSLVDYVLGRYIIFLEPDVQPTEQFWGKKSAVNTSHTTSHVMNAQTNDRRITRSVEMGL